MPISDLHRTVLTLLARNRNPDSYVAGGTLSNVDSPRFSEDIDLFHSSADATLDSFAVDSEVLVGAGYAVQPLLLPRPGFVRARVTAPDGRWLKMDWAHESSWRFFPVFQDDTFGWRLHWLDAATNKVLAAASRSEARDSVDMMHWHRSPLSLGALIWAAVGKDPGYSPDLMLDEIIRNARINPRDLGQLDMATPIDAAALRSRFKQACADARALFEALPPQSLGAVFLDAAGQPAEPDPGDPATLNRVHRGCDLGAWPVVVEAGDPPAPDNA